MCEDTGESRTTRGQLGIGSVQRGQLFSCQELDWHMVQQIEEELRSRCRDGDAVGTTPSAEGWMRNHTNVLGIESSETPRSAVNATRKYALEWGAPASHTSHSTPSTQAYHLAS